jgi:hypothetical protein
MELYRQQLEPHRSSWQVQYVRLTHHAIDGMAACCSCTANRLLTAAVASSISLLPLMVLLLCSGLANPARLCQDLHVPNEGRMPQPSKVQLVKTRQASAL